MRRSVRRRALHQGQGTRLCSAARLSSGGKLPAHQAAAERSTVVRCPAGMWQSAMIKRPWPYNVPTFRPNTFGVRQILHRPVPSRQEHRVVTLDPPVGAGT